MRNIINNKNIIIRSKKHIKYIYETIDFNYKPVPFYKLIIIKKMNIICKRPI